VTEGAQLSGWFRTLSSPSAWPVGGVVDAVAVEAGRVGGDRDVVAVQRIVIVGVDDVVEPYGVGARFQVKLET
jgi:hypothetical protein